MSATEEELKDTVRSYVDGMTELILNGMMTREELVELIDMLLRERGY